MPGIAAILAYFFLCVNCFSQQYPYVHYTPKDGLINSRVKASYQDSKGRIYFITYGGLSVYDGARFKNYTSKNGLSSDVVNDILEVGDDSLLVATNAETNINVLINGKMGVLKTTGETSLTINQFYRHDNNKIYLSSDNGLFILEDRNIRKLDVTALPGKSAHPYLENITGRGNYLVFTLNEMSLSTGLFLYDINRNTICDSLSSRIYLSGKDGNGTIWLGLSHKLYTLDNSALTRGKLVLSPPREVYRLEKSQPVMNATPGKNCIWLIYGNENLENKEIRYADENGLHKKIQLPLQASSSGLRHMMIDKEETIWLSNDGEGVFKLVNSPLLIIPGTASRKNLVTGPDGSVFTIQKNSLDVRQNNKLLFQVPVSSTDNIDALYLDKNNLLWVIKRYTGIEVFRIHPDNISHYLQSAFQFPPRQLTGSPRSFVIDKKGLIWIGTRDHGLSVYKLTGGNLEKVDQFDTGVGLTDNFITALACDSLNNIIVGTQTGVDRILQDSASSRRIENLSKNSNFFSYVQQVWADSIHSFAMTRTGIMLQLPGVRYTTTRHEPVLLLEELKLNAKSITAEKRKFHNTENNLTFFVAAPSFIDEKQVTYSYLLNGSGNRQWSDTSSSNSVINLTNLSPGKYELNVKAFFPSSLYTPAELTWAFEISPPWWQTWWFRVMIGLMFAALLVTGFRFYYRRKMEKQKLALEKQKAIEKERTRIATDMHDDLGAGLSRIKFLSQRMNKQIADETVKSELEKITAFSDEMSEKMGEIIWALNQKNDTVADLIAYTRSYVAEYLENHNIKCEANAPSHLPDSFVPGEIRRNIFLSVKECLHNITKHAQATKVDFTVELNNEMKIVIHDNGKGIDWENMRTFSNGLQNIRQRMKEVNGKVDYKNEEGTKVSLFIPMDL